MESKLVPYTATYKIAATVAVVFAPHPDDEVLGCGGAILRHVATGVPVHVVILSDGAFHADELNRQALIEIREAESREASIVLGYGEPEFWRLPDRGLTYGEALIRRIMDEIRNTAADLVYAPSLLEMHPDHRAAAMCVIEAVRRAPSRPHLALYEVGVPLTPNLLLDISDLAERKMAAMECFVSQNEKQRYDLDIAALNRYRTYTLPPEVTAAEAYILVSAEELANDPLKLYQSEHKRQRELGLALDAKDVPLVSVIIRSMDRPTLSESLDSVALQTYSNIEVVVVNAKGEEHSSLESFCGRFPLRLINDKSKSLARSAAANVGLDAASGAFAMFLDGDDFILPSHIAGLAEILGNTPSISAAYSAVSCVDEQNNPLPQQFGKPFAKTRLMSGNFIPIHSVLFRHSACTAGCRFDERLHLFEDWDFWLQLSETADFQFLPVVTACYRIAASGGFGVNGGNAHDAVLATRILVSKWQQRWSSDTVYELMETSRKNFIALDELNALQTSSKEQTERLEYLETTNQQLQQELNSVTIRLNALLESNSWRITSPIRRIADICRKRAISDNGNH